MKRIGLVYIMANSHRGFQKQNACTEVNICFLCKQMNENDQKIYNTDDSLGNKVEEKEEDRKTCITLDRSF